MYEELRKMGKKNKYDQMLVPILNSTKQIRLSELIEDIRTVAYTNFDTNSLKVRLEVTYKLSCQQYLDKKIINTMVQKSFPCSGLIEFNAQSKSFLASYKNSI